MKNLSSILNPERLRDFIDRLEQDYPHIPASVFRLQLSPQFGFRQAAACIPYLAKLGIAALYTSPYFKAVPGSEHGYDVVDMRQLNPELGRPEDYEALLEALRKAGMGHILDLVPNHMGIAGNANPLWNDVLENGPSSVFAHYFDIEWEPEKRELRDKVLIPILGDHYGRVLEQQEIQLEFLPAHGAFMIRYWGHTLPVSPRSYATILSHGAQTFFKKLQKDNVEEHLSLMNVVTVFENLPSRSERGLERIQERNHEKEIAKDRLVKLVARSSAVRQFIDEQVCLINGKKGKRSSFDVLDELLNEQAYRMAFWRVAAEEINYRRFFDVNDLAAIRIEDNDVFQYQNQLVYKLLEEGKAQGLRIDHPDGLYDPPAYFKKLQTQYLLCLYRRELSEEEKGALELDLIARRRLVELIEKILEEKERGDWKPLFVVAEKILDRKEPLPPDWPVHGTVGYDFLNLLNGLFIDRDQDKAFDEIYRAFTGQAIDFEQLVYERKKFFALIHMSSEINNLAHRLDWISEQDRRYRDFTLNNFTVAIREIIACFPVYRTYILPDMTEVSERDRHYIQIAIDKAKSKTPALPGGLYDFMGDILLLKLISELSYEEERLYRDFILRFQQLTGPVMAKGLEDTSFYIYNRLISLNEVGGDPPMFGVTPHEFHRQNQERQKFWPGSFITASTHDTKRSEDVRMRINVLSEIPVEWHSELNKWAAVNEKYKTLVGESWFPEHNTEYFIYQTLIGVWPLERPKGSDYAKLVARIQTATLKSIREAKAYTNWVTPHQEYEEAVHKFIEAILEFSEENHFMGMFFPFLKRIAHCGMLNSLSAAILRIGAPGVFDLYQGTTLWDDSLVDPDNRRPVPFAQRFKLLQKIEKEAHKAKALEDYAAHLMHERLDGNIKMFVLAKGLQFRRQFTDLMIHGEYIPLKIEGESEKRFITYMRRHENETAIVIASRFFNELISQNLTASPNAQMWRGGKVILPHDAEAGPFRDLFTGKEVVPEGSLGEKVIPISACAGPLTGVLLTNIMVQ